MRTYQKNFLSSSDSNSSTNQQEIEGRMLGKYYMKKFQLLNNPKAKQNDTKLKDKKEDQNQQIMVQQKQVQFGFVPIFKPISPINKVYIYGDFPVEIDFFQKKNNDLQMLLEESKQWSQWKSCQQVKFEQNTNFIEMYQKSNSDGLSNYQDIVNILQSLQDQRMYDLSQALQIYGSNVLTKMAEIKTIFKFIKNRQQVVNYLEGLFIEFRSQGLEWIRQNIDGTLPYTYVFGKIDFVEECYYNCIEGFSLGLLNILGLDIESAARIILKVGKLEFIDQLGRYIKLYKKLIFATQRSRASQEILEYNIITIEGYQIPVKVTAINPPIPIPEIQIPELKNIPLLAFNQILTVFQYEIDPIWLKFLKEKREEENQNQKQLDQALLNDTDCQNINDPFISMYYKEQIGELSEKNQQEMKKCGFAILK